MISASSVASICSRSSRNCWWFRHARFCSLTSKHLIYIRLQKCSCRLSKPFLPVSQSNSSASGSTSSLCQAHPKSQVLQANPPERSQGHNLLTRKRPQVIGQVQQGNQVVSIADNGCQEVTARHELTGVKAFNNGSQPGSQPVYPEQIETGPIRESEAAGHKEARSNEDAVLQAGEAVAVAKHGTACTAPECTLVKHAAAVVDCEAAAVNQAAAVVDGKPALAAQEAAVIESEAAAVNPGLFVLTPGVDTVKNEADAAKHRAVAASNRSFEVDCGITGLECPSLGSNYNTALGIPSMAKAASRVGRIPGSAGITSEDDQVLPRAAKRRSQAAYKQLQQQLQPHFSPPAWAEALVNSVNELDSDQITRALYRVARLVQARYSESGATAPRPAASSNHSMQRQDKRNDNEQSSRNVTNGSSSGGGSHCSKSRSTSSVVKGVDAQTHSNDNCNYTTCNTVNSTYNNSSSVRSVASGNSKSNACSNSASQSGVKQGVPDQQCSGVVNHPDSEFTARRVADSSMSTTSVPDSAEGCRNCAPDIRIGGVHMHGFSSTSVGAQQHATWSSFARTTDSVSEDGCSNGSNRDSGEDNTIFPNVLGGGQSFQSGSREDSLHVRNGCDSTASLQPSHADWRFPCQTECSGQLSHEEECQTATGFPMSSVRSNVCVCESKRSQAASLDTTRVVNRSKAQSRHVPRPPCPGSDVGHLYNREHQPSDGVQVTFQSKDSQTSLTFQPPNVDQSNLYVNAHSSNSDLLNPQSRNHPTHMDHLDVHPNDPPGKIPQSCPQPTSQPAVHSNLQFTRPSPNPDQSNLHTRRGLGDFHEPSIVPTNHPTSNDHSSIPSHLVPLSRALHHIVHHHHHRFRSSAACSAIYLAAILGVTSPVLVSPLLTRVEVTLPHFRPVTHAITLWSLARLECQVPGWLLGHWEAYIVDGLGKFSMRDLSMVTWAFARLQYDPGGLWMSQVFKHMCVLMEGLELDVAPRLGHSGDRREVQNVSEERNFGTNEGNSQGAQSAVWKWDGRGFSNGTQEGRIGGGIVRQEGAQVDRWIAVDHVFDFENSNDGPDKCSRTRVVHGAVPAGRASESEPVRRVKHFGEGVSDSSDVMNFNHAVAGSVDMNKSGEIALESSISRNCYVTKSGGEKAAGSKAGQAEHGMDVVGPTYRGARVVGSAQTGVRALPEREEVQGTKGLESKMSGMKNLQSWELELTADVQTLRHSVDVYDEFLHSASHLQSRELRNTSKDFAQTSDSNRDTQGSSRASVNGSQCSQPSRCNSSADIMMRGTEVQHWSEHTVATESIRSPQGTRCKCETTFCCCSQTSSTPDTSKISSSHTMRSPYNSLNPHHSSPHPAPLLHRNPSLFSPPSPTQLFPCVVQSTSDPPPTLPLPSTPSHCTLQSLAMFAWACTRLDHSPPAYFWTLLFSRTTAYLPMSCSTTLPVLAYSMTELLPRTEVLPPSWTASFLSAAHSKMHSMTLHDICSILLLSMRFCTSIQWTNLSTDVIASPPSPSSPSLCSSPAPDSVGIAVFMLEVAKCSERKLHMASCQDLSILMSGFAAAGVKPPSGWLNRFWKVLRERLEDMNTQGCVAVLAASAKLTLPLPDVLLQSLTQRTILIGIHTLKPMQLHHFMFALAGLGFTPPPSILRQLIWANHSHMTTYYPSALACIITAFSLWLARPSATQGGNVQRTAQQVLASKDRQAQRQSSQQQRSERQSRHPCQDHQEQTCQSLNTGVEQPIVDGNVTIHCTPAYVHADGTIQHENGAATLTNNKILARSNPIESVRPAQSQSACLQGQTPDAVTVTADPTSPIAIPNHVFLPSSWIRSFLECFYKQLPFASSTEIVSTLEALVALRIRPNQAWLQAVLQACALESEQSTDGDRSRLAAVVTALRFSPTEECAGTRGFAGNVDSLGDNHMDTHPAVTNVVEQARQLGQSYEPGVKDRVDEPRVKDRVDEAPVKDRAGQGGIAVDIDFDGEPAGAAGYLKNNSYVEVRYMAGDGGTWDEADDCGGEPFVKQELPAFVASST